MDERSYLRVAKTLNAYGVWTSWCSQFLTHAGFKLIGLPHLERSLRSAGWTGASLVWHDDVDPGSGFGYGHVLIDTGWPGANTDKWLKLVHDHVTEHHLSYVPNGKR
ncbi:MAG: hypothetical protein JO199_08950, partial [Candidatus Eremiobacteraeota bacterium]|nr:hypothetical protein [Candidatus Eremiobacteraeota bacterium]